MLVDNLQQVNIGAVFSGCTFPSVNSHALPSFADIIKDYSRQRLSYIKQYDEMQEALYISARVHLKPFDLKSVDLKKHLYTDFLAVPKTKVLLLVGNSGSGKTLFCRHLEQELLENYIENKESFFPILIRLTSLDNPVRSAITEKMKEVGFTEHCAGLKEKRFLFILDSYDEIRAEENLYITNKFSDWLNSKVIVTCRQEYLGKGRENFKPRISGSFLEWTILPFMSQEIEDYLKKYIDQENRKPMWTQEQYLAKIRSMPGLNELASVPLLLRIIAQVLPEMALDPTQQQVTRFELYEKFMGQSIQEQITKEAETSLKKLRAPEEGDEKECWEWIYLYAQKKALELYNQDAIEFKKPDVKHEEFKLRCLPLTRDCRKFLYRFRHKSIQEFLISVNILEHIKDENLQVLNKKFLNSEYSIIGFIVDKISEDFYFQNQLWLIVGRSKLDDNVTIASANAATFLNAAKVTFSARDLSSVKISGADLRGSVCDNTNFMNATLEKVLLAGSYLDRANFTNSKMEGSQFGELPYIHLGREGFFCPSLCYSQDGTLLAVVAKSENSQEKSHIRLFDNRNLLDDSKKLPHDRVSIVIFSPLNPKLLASCSEREVKIWDCSNDQKMQYFHDNNHLSINCLAFSYHTPMLLALGYENGTVRIWNIPNNQYTNLANNYSSVRSVFFHPKKEHLVASSHVDGMVKIWDWVKKAPIKNFSHPQCVWSIAISVWKKSVNLLASGIGIGVYPGSDNEVWLWNTENDIQPLFVSSISHHTWTVQSVAFSHNGELLASGSRDHTVILWDLSDLSKVVPIRILRGHFAAVRSVFFFVDSKRLASASEDGYVKFWEIEGYDLRLMSELNGAQPSKQGTFYVCLVDGGIQYTVLSESNIIIEGRITTEDLGSEIIMPIDDNLEYFESIKKNILGVASERGHAKIQKDFLIENYNAIDLSTAVFKSSRSVVVAKLNTIVRRLSASLNSLRFGIEHDLGLISELNGAQPSKQGTFYVCLVDGGIQYTVLSESNIIIEGRITTEDLGSGIIMPTCDNLEYFESIKKNILGVALERGHISLGSRSIVCSLEDGIVISDEERFQGHTLAMSSNQDVAVRDFSSKAINIFNHDGVLLWSYPINMSKDIWSLSFNPINAQQLAFGTSSGCLLLADKEKVYRIEVPESFGEVRCVTFSRDGKKLAVGHGNHINESIGNTADKRISGVRVFDLVEKKIICLLRHYTWIKSIAFSPDSTLLAIGCENKYLYIVDLKKFKSASLKSLRDEAILQEHSSFVSVGIFWGEIPEKNSFLVVVYRSGSIHYWDIHKGIDNKIKLQLMFSSQHSVLSARDTNITYASGLSKENAILLKQIGAFIYEQTEVTIEPNTSVSSQAKRIMLNVRGGVKPDGNNSSLTAINNTPDVVSIPPTMLPESYRGQGVVSLRNKAYLKEEPIGSQMAASEPRLKYRRVMPCNPSQGHCMIDEIDTIDNPSADGIYKLHQSLQPQISVSHATQTTVHRADANLTTPISRETKASKLSSEVFPGFEIEERELGQLGWNCFDIAVGVGRKDFVKYALENSCDESMQKLLSPELQHSIALTTAYMNDPSVFFGNQQYLLPQGMRTIEMKEIFETYQNIHENQGVSGALMACNNTLGYAEGCLLNWDQLKDFFAHEQNRMEHAVAYDRYQEGQHIILTAEKSLKDYCSRQDIYEQYITQYYGNNEWVSFNAEFTGEHSTGMIDIVAKMLGASIVIHQHERPNQETAAYGPREIHIAYTGNNHFRALRFQTQISEATERLTNIPSGPTVAPTILPAFASRQGGSSPPRDRTGRAQELERFDL